jgi:chaperonin GroES
MPSLLSSNGVMRSQLRPFFDRVVIKELDPDRVRRSGLLVPAGSDEPPPQHGIVLAVGPGLDWWDHVGVRMPVNPGDHVVFPASAGTWIEVDEERLLVCRVGELLGVLEQIEKCPACLGRRLDPQESCPVCGREGSVVSD